MTNNEYIKLLIKKRDQLVYICKFHNIHNDYDQDEIIQRLYLKILEYKDIDKYVKDNDVNMFIIFAMIRNIIYDFRKNENKYISDDFKYNEEFTNVNNTSDKYEFILDELEHIKYWFDRTIVSMYVYDAHTIRSLSKELKIGTTVIQQAVYKFKLQSQDKYKNQNTI